MTNSQSRRTRTGLPVFAGRRSSATLAVSSADSRRRAKSDFMTLSTAQKGRNRSGELPPPPRRSYPNA